MQSLMCRACGRKSKVTGIDQLDGVLYVVFEHCNAKNRLLQRPTPIGAPAQFEVVGLLEKPTGA